MTKPNLIPYIGKFLKCSFFYNCLSGNTCKNAKPTETLVLYKHQRSSCLTFDLSSKATHIGLPYMYLSIFFSEFTGLFELKFHMEYSEDTM